MKNKKNILILIISILIVLICVALLLFLNKGNKNLGKYQVYTPGDKIYYNPVSNESCKNGEENCNLFYVITTNDNSNLNTIDMILDHNLGENINWGNYNDGPITALQYLKNQTENWSSELSVPNLNYRTFESFSNTTYTLDYSGYKARLITVEEIIEILKYNSKFSPYWKENEKNDLYGLPDWLLSNTEGLGTSKIDDYIKTNGYWTSNPYYNENINNYAWIVYGFVGVTSESTFNEMIGVRPVITVSKNVITKEEKEEKYFTKLNDFVATSTFQGEINENYILTSIDEYVYALYDNNGILIDRTNKYEKIELLEDGYYTIEAYDNIYLKKYGELISTNDYDEINKHKKDEKLQNCDYTLFDDERCASFEYKDDIVTTTVYDTKTGEKIKELSGYLNNIYIDYKKQYNYYAFTENSSSNAYLLDKNLDIITDKYLINDTRLGEDLDFDFPSDKQIISLKDNKYGVIDYKGNIVLEFVYDELIYSDGYYVNKANQKYGLIDEKGNIIFEPMYDAINSYGNYFITFKDGKISIFDKNKSVIKEQSYEFNELKYSYYSCCDHRNPYEIKKINENSIIIEIAKDVDDIMNYLVVSNNKAYNFDFDDYIVDGSDKIIVSTKKSDKQPILTIYDSNMKKLKEQQITINKNEFDYMYVDKITDNVYLITYNDNHYVYNINKNELEEATFASVINEKLYYISKNNNILIYDENDNLLQTIEGSYINKFRDNLFIVQISKEGYYRSQYQIYKINK